MRTTVLLISCVTITGLHAQLLNGSFEDEEGNPTWTGWVGTCDVMPGPAAPGFGDYGILVPHSNAPGCGWSRLDQLVPAIQDGSTWTLSGWCANFTWFWADPYSGFRFGIKRADGTLEFNTAALQNTGSWTYLSVTNSFSLADGDTVFVECDPGTVSGLGENQVMAMFDGVELADLSTSVGGPDQGPELHLWPSVVQERLWVASDEPLLELRIVEMSGSMRHREAVTLRHGAMELDVSGLRAGAYVLWARSASGVVAERFVKQ